MLATNAGLLTPILGDPSPWNPERLYINGEAGVWYDPGDLTAEKVAWRRNLLTWSEQFDNAAWVKNTSSITATNGADPLGGNNADRWVSNVGSTTHYLGQTLTLGFTGSVTMSAWVRSATGSNQTFTLFVGSGIASGNLTATPTWQRFTFTTSSSFTATLVYGVSRDSSNSAVDLWVYGAQLELGTTASAYQRITDFTSDFLAAFPTHALYQDAAGTTPVTALGQPVGLALDKSRGALANTTELFVNPDCTSLTGFSAQGTNPPTLAFNNGVQATVTIDDAASRIQTTTITGFVVGRMYLVEVTATSACAKGNLVASAFTWGTITDTNFALGTTTRRIFVTATATSGVCRYYLGNTADNDGNVATITRHSVREVPGVHKIQPTSASREALDARVNLLTYSEQFDNAAWTKLRATVTANSTVGPDGQNTADSLLDTAVSGTHVAIQTITKAASSVAYIASVYAKKDVRDQGELRVSDQSGNGVRCAFNLTTGAIGTFVAFGTGFTATSSQIEALGSGWYRIVFSVTTNAATTVGHEVYVADATGNTSYTGTGAGFFVVGADLRLATDAAYPYQRVVTATDYADVGVPRSFLHDGFDDSSYTASSLDLSGTDKVTVWAGVYKNSDAATAILAELTSAAVSNAFYITAPTNPTTVRYRFGSAGSLTAEADATAAIYAAPSSVVLSALGNISGDVATLRLNGVQVGASTADQGTGNYSNAVLYMGRRNNASLPFNGKIYTIIIRGGVTDAATLALTERYVGSRMGIVL